MIPLILAAAISFTLPLNSADENCQPTIRMPAGVKKVRAWCLNVSRGDGRYRLAWALNYPVAGKMDGKRLRLSFGPSYCSPGDSVVFRVAVGDSSLNWAGRGCGGDAEIAVRVMPGVR